MIFEVDGFRFRDQEVAIQGFFQTANFTPRGQVYSITRTMAVAVDTVTLVGQIALDQYFGQIMVYLNTHPRLTNVGFLRSDGGRSNCYMTLNRAYSDLLCIQQPSWTPQSEVEFATHLTLQMVFQCEYDPPDAAQLLNYQEALYFEDEGPSRVVPVVTDTGPVEPWTLASQAPQYITQAGFAEWRSGWADANSPLFNLPYVSRARGYVTPVMRGKRHVGYRTEWNYRYFTGLPANGRPSIR